MICGFSWPSYASKVVVKTVFFDTSQKVRNCCPPNSSTMCNLGWCLARGLVRSRITAFWLSVSSVQLLKGIGDEGGWRVISIVTKTFGRVFYDLCCAGSIFVVSVHKACLYSSLPYVHLTCVYDFTFYTQHVHGYAWLMRQTLLVSAAWESALDERRQLGHCCSKICIGWMSIFGLITCSVLNFE